MSFVRSLALAAFALLFAHPAAAQRSVLLISVDGLRADDITKADEKGLKIPNLRALAAGGAHAKGVRGVLPTVTYPSHTTMITGVHPNKHGIGANVVFDPEGKNAGGWIWYSSDIKVPTLWHTVKAKGGKVASIGWPVSVGTQAIDYNVPEFWRTKTPEDEKLLRALSTPGMQDEIAEATGASFAAVALDPGPTHAGMDPARMLWVPAIIERYKPQLTTVHLVELDGVRHVYGPHSPEARVLLEQLDGLLGTMLAKVRAADPNIVVALVSDHGFFDTGKGLNLEAAFAAEGLITYNDKGKVESWRAFPWLQAGSAAILLKDPADTASAEKARALLARLAANPANGIDKVLERGDIDRLGGTKDAFLWVAMREGFSAVGGTDKALLRDISGRGAHGYSPENDALLSVFVLSGPGIKKSSLGVIDMRDIGTTLGEVLGAPLPAPDGKVLPVVAPNPKPLVAGHRGGALLWPENVLPSFQKAAKAGVEILEFDMNLTKDDQIVLMHDTSINDHVCVPKKGAKVSYGPVRERTLAEMRQFDCGTIARDIYPTQKPIPGGAKVTTLDEFLTAFRKSKHLLFGETKMPKAGQPEVDPALFARLVEAKIREYGVEDRFIYQSSDYRTIDALHAINPRIRTCLVHANRAKPDYLALARKHNAGCVVLPAKDVTRAQVQELQANNVWVFGDVADTEAMWAEHVKLGVHTIITNDPVGLVAYLKKQ